MPDRFSIGLSSDAIDRLYALTTKRGRDIEKLHIALAELVRVCSTKGMGGEIEQLSQIKGRLVWYKKMRIAREAAQKVLMEIKL